MLPTMQDLDVEEAWALLLNQNFRLIKRIQLSRGGITETAIDVRLLIKEALLAGATTVAFCHNHPSGNAQPSRDDDRLTENIQKACSLMQPLSARSCHRDRRPLLLLSRTGKTLKNTPATTPPLRPFFKSYAFTF